MNRQWYEDAIIYHIYALSLRSLAEIEKWIPHIKGMGCNAVLFSPVLTSQSHGYDVTDYFKIDSRLGSNDEFRALVQRFHENGIRIILDSVFNHCGRDFFAFKELRDGNLNYAAWFSGVDFNRQSPLGDPFTYDTWSGHYELPKFNLHNDAARNYLLDAARFWIDTFGIDGMRLDSANVLDFGFMTELRRVTTEKKPDFWLMGEVVHGDYTKWVNDSVLHSVTNYKLYKSLYSSHNDDNLYELAYCLRNAVPDNGLPLNTFLDNHDQGRIASVVSNPAFLSTLYTLLFTAPGIPSVYYGSEWAFEGVKQAYSDQNLRPYIDIDKRYEYDTWLTGHISRLIRIRQGENALKYGSCRHIYFDYHRPLVFERSCEDERIYIAVNIADHDDVISLRGYGNAFRDLLDEERITDPAAIQIKPHSARILKSSNS